MGLMYVFGCWFKGWKACVLLRQLDAKGLLTFSLEPDAEPITLVAALQSGDVP